jgi:hypothetical protein
MLTLGRAALGRLHANSISKNSVYTCRDITYLYPSSGFTPLPIFTIASYYTSTLGAIPFTSVKPSSIHGDPATLAFPYTGSTFSFKGIRLFNNNPVAGSATTQMFDLSSKSNMFDRHISGIWSEDVNLTVSKQFFYYIHSPSAGIGVALLSYGIPNPGSSVGAPPTVSAGTSAATANTFSHCDLGILVQYPTKSINVSFNTLRDIDFGIRIDGVATSSSSSAVICNIVSNTIKNIGITAIWLNNNVNINGNVWTNTIGQPVPNFTSTGILVTEASPVASANAFYNIDQNTIDFTYNGIECWNTNQAQITSNIIQINTPSSFPLQYNYGIASIACYNNSVGNNIVTGDNNLNHWWQVGINNVNHNAQNIFCNVVTGTYGAINFNGSPSMTLPGFPVRNNDMHDNFVDVWLQDGCALGAQKNMVGPLTQPVDNRFYHGTPSGWYSSYCSGSPTQTIGNNSQFYTRNNPVTDFAMTSNGAQAAGPPSFPMAPISLAGLPYHSNCTSTKGHHRPIINLAHAIAVDSLFPPTALTNINLSRHALFNNIMMEGVNTAGDVALTNFINTHTTGNIGTFYKIDEDIANAFAQNNPAFLTAASNLNTNLIPADSMQLLQKQVNTSFINYLINGFTFAPADISSLKQIAPLCPIVYGNAVWEARSLILGIDNTQYFNTCEIITRPGTTSNRIMQNDISETNDNITASIYPNPNNGSFNVSFVGAGKLLKAEVYNVFGQEIVNKEFALGNQTNTLQIEGLTDGIYIIKLTVDGKIIKTDKIIVTK